MIEADSPTSFRDITRYYGLVIIIGLFSMYLACLGAYRLWLSPMSQYPGPKLAALTQWVETYYELRGDGGQFMFKIDQWHDIYGPIVRISPHETHIRDPEFYEVFYSSSYVADRRSVLAHRFGIPLSSHFTADHYAHRRRRAAMNPTFSKRKAAAFCSTIQTIMNHVCDTIDAQYCGSGSSLNMNAMWGCVASDVVSKYALGISFGFIETPNFDSTFVTGMAKLLEPLHIVTQFPLLGSLLMHLPDWLTVRLQPAMQAVLHFKSEVTDQVRAIKEAVEQASKDSNSDIPDTLINNILQSNLPPSDLTLERIRDEAIGVIGAGVETIYRALTVGSYHILANSSIRRSLELELKAAIPDSAHMPSCDVLKQLPYLSACVKEIERIGIGTSQRSPRIFRRSVPQYHVNPLVSDQVFSMSIRDVHFDPKIFPHPYEFLPARWLPSNFVPDGLPVEQLYQPRAPSGKLLTRYLVPFARGPRNCVGMHLADVEIYVGLATLMRRFAGTIVLEKGVGPESVAIWMDRFVPRERPGVKKVLAVMDA